MPSNVWSTESELDFIKNLSDIDFKKYASVLRHRKKWGSLDGDVVMGYVINRSSGFVEGK